jgi:hypothetical protein
LGAAVMARWLQQLREAASPGCHLLTLVENRRAQVLREVRLPQPREPHPDCGDAGQAGGTAAPADHGMEPMTGSPPAPFGAPAQLGVVVTRHECARSPSGVPPGPVPASPEWPSRPPHLGLGQDLPAWLVVIARVQVHHGPGGQPRRPAGWATAITGRWLPTPPDRARAWRVRPRAWRGSSLRPGSRSRLTPMSPPNRLWSPLRSSGSMGSAKTALRPSC